MRDLRRESSCLRQATTFVGESTRVALSGELDPATSPLLERELIRVERTGVSLTELDRPA